METHKVTRKEAIKRVLQLVITLRSSPTASITQQKLYSECVCWLGYRYFSLLLLDMEIAELIHAIKIPEYTTIMTCAPKDVKLKITKKGEAFIEYKQHLNLVREEDNLCQPKE